MLPADAATACAVASFTARSESPALPWSGTAGNWSSGTRWEAKSTPSGSCGNKTPIGHKHWELGGAYGINMYLENSLNKPTNIMDMSIRFKKTHINWISNLYHPVSSHSASPVHSIMSPFSVWLPNVSAITNFASSSPCTGFFRIKFREDAQLQEESIIDLGGVIDYCWTSPKK